MGYTTYFTGEIEVDPPLSPEHIKVLNDFNDERHGGNTEVYEGFPGFWCQWVPTNDGKGIEWDGCEKFYDATEWMQYLMDHFLTPWGYTCNGVIDAQGEMSGDIWRLEVKDNQVQERRAKITYE